MLKNFSHDVWPAVNEWRSFVICIPADAQTAETRRYVLADHIVLVSHRL